MNQNCIFSLKEQPVQIFHFVPSHTLPFKHELVSTRGTINELGNPVIKDIYECYFDLMSVEVVAGDFIVLGARRVYHEGVMQIVPYVEAHTRESIIQNYLAYDEYVEDYLDNIMDAFYNEPELSEPSDADLMAIDRDVEDIVKKAKTMTIDDLLEEDGY